MPRKNLNTIEKPVASAQSRVCTRNNSANKNASTAEDEEKLAVYEFTFDPNEEPEPPKKQKKKRAQKKKETKPMWSTTTTRSNYDKNVNIKLNQLRKIVSSKTSVSNLNKKQKSGAQLLVDKSMAVNVISQNANPITYDQNEKEPHSAVTPEPLGSRRLSLSVVRECQEDDETEGVTTTLKPISSRRTSDSSEVSFFNVQPIANSSFNMLKSPAGASPWRVDIDVAPKKWPVNFYVKPSMTPAYDSSFAEVELHQNKQSPIKYAPILISPSDSPHKSRPCIFEDATDTPNDSRLKQPRIIEYIQQKVLSKSDKKSPSKKKKALENITPTKDNSLFNETCPSAEKTLLAMKLRSSTIRNLNFDCTPKDINKENVQRDIANKENITDENRNITKPRKSDKFFGFDESDILDRENISPEENIKNNNDARKTKLQLRKALKEVNEIQGPMRANINVHEQNQDRIALKQIKQALVHDKKCETAIREECEAVDPEEVPLFEDLECIQHHHRLERKSYGGKAPHQRDETVNNSESESEMSVTSNKLDEEDVGEEPGNFTYLDIEKDERRKRTKKRKKVLSKKEKNEAEADQWAKSFMSELQEASEFPLLVE